MTPQEWKRIADQFADHWQMFHALAVIDGKHVLIKCLRNGESLFYNYKGFYSIILLALVDADYKFLWIDIRQNGSSSDAQIFNQSELKESIENGMIGFAPADPLAQDDRLMPYFLLGDDAIALRIWLMISFSNRNMSDVQRIFNYRLSQGQGIAFSILANQFQCVLSPLLQQSNTVNSIVLACVCLHNLMHMCYPGLQNALLDQEGEQYQVILGSWRNGANLQDVDNLVGGNRISRMSKKHVFFNYLTI